jgi:hypothetical protein
MAKGHIENARQGSGEQGLPEPVLPMSMMLLFSISTSPLFAAHSSCTLALEDRLGADAL